MKNLKNIFAAKKDKVELQPGEYEGPIKIDYACTVEGNGATLWTKSGAALVIDADNVTIKNLRVELTETLATETAIEVRGENVKFENVEVFGQVKDAKKSFKTWDLPRTIKLGNFAAKVQNEFVIKLKISEPCKIVNQIYGLKISAENLSVGETELQFTISPLPDNIILFGSFLLVTAAGIVRRIFVQGLASNNAPEVHQKISSPVTEKISVPKNSTAEIAIKGQRITIPQEKIFKVVFEDEGHDKMEIDAYAFMLAKDDKVRGDKDFIFFNNKQSSGGGVTVGENFCGVTLDLQKIPAAIRKVAICFAIYGDNQAENFLKVKSPTVTVYVDEKVIFEFNLQVGNVKAITALEFYRRNGIWKINFVGAGFSAGLKKLCESYNLEVN